MTKVHIVFLNSYGV